MFLPYGHFIRQLLNAFVVELLINQRAKVQKAFHTGVGRFWHIFVNVQFVSCELRAHGYLPENFQRTLFFNPVWIIVEPKFPFAAVVLIDGNGEERGINDIRCRST